MRLMMGLSTLVIAAVALLWLALRPVQSPRAEPPPPRTAEKTPSAPPSAPAPATPKPETLPPTAPPPAAPPSRAPGPSEARAVDPAPGAPARHRLVPPRATPIPRPVQAIPTPRPVAPAPEDEAPEDEAPEDEPADPPPAREAIKSAIRSAKPLVADCYTQALAHSPALAGTLKVSFTVTADADGSGRIRDAEVLDDGLRQPFLEMCVLEALGTAEYPIPAGGGQFKVTYPFVLKAE